jgi:hypothetical protein
VMHFLLSLLRIKGLSMFRALLAHPQEVLYKRHLVYCVRVMSVGCTRIGVELVQPTDITHTQYTKCRLCSVSWGWASNARNMQRPLILNKLNKKCITLVSLYWEDLWSLEIFRTTEVSSLMRNFYPSTLQGENIRKRTPRNIWMW